MPYDDGIIYVNEMVTPNVGVSIADIQRAVPVVLQRVNTRTGAVERRSSGTLGLLCGASIGDTVAASDGEGNWTVVSRIDINPMAKFKPVRYNKLQPLTASEFRNTNYGMSIGPIFNAANPNSDISWTYNKPRGKLSSSSPQGQLEDEPYRDTDFEGYDHKSCPPFQFDVSGELDNAVGLTFAIDSFAKEKYPGMRWTEEGSFRLSDLIAVTGRYLCVGIYDLHPDHPGSCAVIFNKKVSEIGQYGYSMQLFANGGTFEGKTCPEVELFQGRDRNGHTFRFIVGMRNNNDGQSNNQGYKVVGTNQIDGMYSLALMPGIDRKDVVLTLLDTIGRLQFSLSRTTETGLTLRYDGTVTRNNSTWKKYMLSGRVYATFVTPQGQWAVGTVSVDTFIRSDGGYVNPTDNGTTLVGRDNVWSKGQIDISQGNHTYNDVEVARIYNEIPVYIYHDAEASVQVSAKVNYISETKDASNKIIVTA